MIQKTIQDYYEILYKEYPDVPKEDIKRICQYGWKSLYLHNSCGGDTLINRQDFWFYCGSLTKNSLRHFRYYIRKMIVKLRIMYKRKKIAWDGYYYFALTRSQYNQYLEQKNKRGRPRKNFTFEKLILYKIYDECNLANYNKVALFRLPVILEGSFTTYKETLTTDKAELVLVRDPLKFDDILLSNYEYQFITDNLRRYKHNNNE